MTINIEPNSPDVETSSDSNSGIDDLRGPIESALRRACQFGEKCPERLQAAMQYSLLAPGKRLRPAMVLMAAEACGGSVDEAMPGAVAVEMVHAYSLIHDDLPAMDDDELRRGRPTCHIKFGEATAILAGDALLAQAFAHLSETVSDSVRLSESVRVLAKAAGPTALVGGQADDLAAAEEMLPRSIQSLESIHRRKTGALFAASLDLGGVLSGGSDSQRKVLGDYASDIGLAFQVVDDLLDCTSETAILGKKAGKDADLGKLTYPGLLGIEGARNKAKCLIESALARVSVFGPAAWRLSWLARYVLERTH